MGLWSRSQLSLVVESTAPRSRNRFCLFWFEKNKLRFKHITGSLRLHICRSAISSINCSACQMHYVEILPAEIIFNVIRNQPKISHPLGWSAYTCMSTIKCLCYGLTHHVTCTDHANTSPFSKPRGHPILALINIREFHCLVKPTVATTNHVHRGPFIPIYTYT